MYMILEETLDDFFEVINCDECDGENCADCPVMLQQATEDDF